MTLRILSVAYPLAPVRGNAVGGAEQILAEIDAALVERGHRSLVIACEGSETRGELIALPHIVGTLDASSVELARARLAWRIRAVLASRRIDLIHMHGFDFHHYLPPAGVPILVTLHLPLSHYSRDALLPGRPDTWLNCVSAVQHKDVEDHPLMLPPIENGVRTRKTEGRTKGDGFALMLTRICPEKGVHHAIEAAKLAGVPLIICGETFSYPEHLRYFNEEIAPRLDRLHRFIGPVGGDRKSWLLGAARCLLIPSMIAETSSLVAREALAAGTPVIAWRSGALPEVVEHGRTGFLVDDVEAMAAAIDRTHELSPADCFAAARDRFSLDRMIDGYFSAYRTILARAGKAAREGRCGMSTRLETATIDTDTALARLAPEWDLLWQSAPQATPFQAPGWLLSWWEIFAPGTLSIITVRRQGALVGLAPLCRDSGAGPAHLLPLGVPITDYSDILVEPALKREVVNALSDHLARSTNWQSLHWPDLPQDAGVSSLAFPSSYQQTAQPSDVCPYLSLPTTVAEFETILPPRKSRSLRMAAHRAERRGKVTLHSLQDRPAEDMLADLFVLHRLCWQIRGQSGVLDDERVRRFHMQAAPKLAAAGVLRLYSLQIGGETAAVYYGFLRGEHAYGYLTGFNPAFSYESPGTLVVAHAIREAVREGAREFHFLRGGEAYKYGWGAQDRWNTSRTIRRALADAEA